MPGEPLGGGAVRAVTHQDELGGDFTDDLGEDLDGVDDALDGPEIRQVHQNGFAGICQATARFVANRFVLVGRVDIAVDEVADDLDLALDVERLSRAIAQLKLIAKLNRVRR